MLNQRDVDTDRVSAPEAIILKQLLYCMQKSQNIVSYFASEACYQLVYHVYLPDIGLAF